MAQYLLVNDIHLSDRPPSSCTVSYLDDLFDLLGHVNILAEQRFSAAVILAGDVFHHKSPARTTHASVRRLIELARDSLCPWYVVVGNHDVSHDRLETLGEGQPLGVAVASGALRLLHGWHADIGDQVYGVPWLGQWNDQNLAAALGDWRSGVAANEPALIVTHAPLYPPGRELPYENYPTTSFAAGMGGHGSVHYGHVHEPHGIYTVGGVNFCNPGALSRGSLHEHNLTREVAISCWDSFTGAFEILPLPHKPADQVFRLEQIGQAGAAQQRLDEFLDSVGSTHIQVTTIEAVMAHIRTLNLGRELETLVEELLVGVR